MYEYTALIMLGKMMLSFTIVTLCEYNQPRPYYYKLEILLGSMVIAAVPLVGHVILYLATAYLLRHYPYGTVRAWMWPVELYRAAFKRITNRYPFRR